MRFFTPAQICFSIFALSISVFSCQPAVAQNNFNRLPFRSSLTPPLARVAKLSPQESQSRRSNLYPSSSSTRKPTVESNSFPSASNELNTNAINNRETPSTFSSQLQEPTGASRISSDRSRIEIAFGSIMLIDDIDLPALEPGAIKNLSVTEGQFIPQGMVVGMIDDDLLLAEYEQQKKRYENARKLAMDEVSIRAAEKEYALALEEFRKADRLFRSRSVSESERNQKKFAAEIANLKMLKAQNDQTTARGEAELELARLAIVQKRIARHVLKSEYDAYVIKIYKKKQEYVQAGEEVMRLGRMDELWAQGNVYASDLDEHNAINRPVTVTLKMADGKTVTFEGRVEQVPLERQSSDQYAVKVRIKNRRANQDVNGSWLLRPLARVSMVIHLDRGFVDDMPDAIRSTPVTPVKGSQLAPLPVGK